MDPISIAIIVGVSAVAALIGEALAAGDREQAAEIRRRAAEAYGEVELPKLDALVVEQLGKSRLNDVSTDPRNAAIQRRALEQLVAEGDANGMTTEDQAVLNEVQAATAQQERSAREAISASAYRRGMGGAGLTVAMQGQAQQEGATRAHRGGLQVAADARRRALGAIAGAGELAGDMDDTEYSRKARAATADDERELWNRNADINAHVYNQGLKQQGYENDVGLIDRKNDAQLGYADHLDGKADATSAGVRQVGNAAGSLYAKYPVDWFGRKG